jgi:hypothetical protein
MKKENPTIECACGCKQKLTLYDNHYRKRSFISGHNGRKYEDPTQYKREWNHRNRKQRQEYKIKRIYEIRENFILRAGGKCVNCHIEYDKTNACIFDFHHINPNEKVLNLNHNAINKYNLEQLENEFKKCVLYCSNCHRLMHHHQKNFNTASPS